MRRKASRPDLNGSWRDNTLLRPNPPQGGVISPLLANIALHGLEEKINDFAKRIDYRDNKGNQLGWQRKVKSLNFIRYADDFVVLHENKSAVQGCRKIISEWLLGIGLELKPEKTRLTHTLNPELSEDGKAGFDFLGYHIQQYQSGKHKSARNTHGEIQGFNTLITPSVGKCNEHQQDLKRIILKHRSSPQTALIKDLNPVIGGWTRYYTNSDAKTVGELSRQDQLTYLKLRRWAKRRCGNINEGHKKYFITIGGNNWVFATKEELANPLRLLRHNGDLVYWSTRKGKHPELPNRMAYLLKRQKGKCPWCKHHFQEWDVMEVDHKKPKALGGRDEMENLQLLHRHCHDEKTKKDMEVIRKQDTSRFFDKVNKTLDKYEWRWINDILMTWGYKANKGSEVPQ